MKTLLYLSLTLAACRLSAQSLPTAPAAAQSLIRHLPPDACAIYHFNLKVLQTKIPLQQLTDRIPLPQKNTSNRELAAILREPGRAGVDTTRDLFIAETTDSTTSLFVYLADSSRWSAFLKEQVPGLRIASSWNKNIAILTFARKAGRAAVRAQKLLTGFPDSIALPDSLFSDDADIHAWTDQGKLVSLLTQHLFHFEKPATYPALTPPGCGKVHTLSSLRFEKGRILLKNTLRLPKGIDTLYTRLTNRPLPAFLLSQIPSGAILGQVNIHFDPAAIAPLLDGLQARGRSEALLFDKGVSLETFVHSFSGDFLLTAIQPPRDTAAADTSAKKPYPKSSLYLAATLRDLPSFWSWTSHLKWLNPTIDPNGAGRVSTRNPISKKLPAYLLKDSTLVISSSAKKAAAWWAPRPNSDTLRLSYRDPAFPPRGDTSRFHSCPISGWVDFQALNASLQKRPAQNSANRSLLSALDMLTFTAGYLTPDGQLENITELTLINNEENSLKTIFKLLQ